MDNIQKLSIFILPYTVIISVSYLTGYWHTFNIDVFSYLSASDIIVMSAVPLFSIGLLTAIGVAFGTFPDKKIKNSKKGVLDKIYNALFISFSLYIIFFGGSLKWIFIPILFSLFVIFIGINFYKKYIIDKKDIILNNIAVFATLIFIPFQSFGYGKYSAHSLKDGTEYRYLSSKIEGINVTANKNTRYIGKAGSYIFFYKSAEEEVLIVSFPKIKELTLKSHPSFVKKSSKAKEKTL